MKTKLGLILVLLFSSLPSTAGTGVDPRLYLQVAAYYSPWKHFQIAALSSPRFYIGTNRFVLLNRLGLRHQMGQGWTLEFFFYDLVFIEDVQNGFRFNESEYGFNQFAIGFGLTKFWHLYNEFALEFRTRQEFRVNVGPLVTNHFSFRTRYRAKGIKYLNDKLSVYVLEELLYVPPVTSTAIPQTIFRTHGGLLWVFSKNWRLRLEPGYEFSVQQGEVSNQALYMWASIEFFKNNKREKIWTVID